MAQILGQPCKFQVPPAADCVDKVAVPSGGDGAPLEGASAGGRAGGRGGGEGAASLLGSAAQTVGWVTHWGIGVGAGARPHLLRMHLIASSSYIILFIHLIHRIAALHHRASTSYEAREVDDRFLKRRCDRTLGRRRLAGRRRAARAPEGLAGLLSPRR